LLMVFFSQQYDERSRDIFGENYERLSQIKAKYDPKNMFDKLFAITPATEA
jgi:FAD/FMN-containing dehydrogenase